MVDGVAVALTAPTDDQLSSDSYKLDNYDLNARDQMQDKKRLAGCESHQERG